MGSAGNPLSVWETWLSPKHMHDPPLPSPTCVARSDLVVLGQREPKTGSAGPVPCGRRVVDLVDTQSSP